MPDDFLLVTSEAWVEVDGVAEHIENNIGLATLQGLINDGAWESILTAFGDAWQPPAGQALTGARVFSDPGIRFFARLEAA